MDVRTEYLQEIASKTLNVLIGEIESEARQLKEHLFILEHTYNLIVDYRINIRDTLR